MPIICHLHRLVEHRQPADLLSLHDVHGVLDVLVVAAIGDAGGHHVLGLDVGNALVVGHTTDGNVPIGDHADERAVGGDRNAADIELAHSLGDGSDLGLGRNAFETLMHHVSLSWATLLQEEMPSV